MNTSTLTLDFFQQTLEDQAWTRLSKKFTWSEQLLEKYQDKVDWEEISSNTEVLWTTSLLERFKKRLNWSKLSEMDRAAHYFTTQNLEQFKDYWDWHKLSKNESFIPTFELLEKYADKWDWEKIINRGYIHYKPEDFIMHFEKYIPINKLQNSNLWNNLVRNKTYELIDKLVNS